MGVYFIAAGNSTKNRDKTLDTSHTVESLLRLVPPDVGPRLIDAFPSGEGVYAWGASDRGHRKVLGIPEDTYVVDIANASVKQVFRFAFAYRAPDLQIQDHFEWDDHLPLDDRRPYPIVYFLRGPQKTSRTESKWFRSAFGIGHRNWLPGQKMFSDREVAAAMERTGEATVEAFLGLPTTGTSDPGPYEARAGSGRVAESRERQYWALAADPRKYRIDEAVRSMDRPDLWTTRGRDFRAGDRVVVWKTSGGGGRRGVVALGEVTGPVRETSDAENPYWVAPDESVGPRVPVRYAVPPGLPLYLGDDGDEPARALSVARARGGTVFNVGEGQWDALVAAVGGFEAALQEAEEDEAEAALRASDAPETEKAQVVRARRGQGVFRRRVAEVEPKCRLTGTSDPALLRASHIKPWRDATNAERLDGDNGLLLAPHVDALFDAGLLSFTDDGDVLTAGTDVRAEMERWGLDPDANVGPFNERQRGYLAHHRSEVYRPRV